MYKVTLINRMLIVTRPNNSMIGHVYASRVRALRMYMLIAGRLDVIDMLSIDSSIVA